MESVDRGAKSLSAPDMPERQHTTVPASQSAREPLAVTVAQTLDFDEVIDVRSESEYAEDHIPGAINCPVLDNTDTAMKDLDAAVKAFAETNAALEKVVRELGPLVDDMDEMVRDMDDVAEAAKKMWVLRRRARKREDDEP